MQQAILHVVKKIESNMDKKMFSCGIFINLKKPFYTVDHSILLSKLQHYGIRGIINDWFSSYLTGGMQTTPGSVFLIYVNDIHNSSDKFSLYLFANDTHLLYADRKLRLLLIKIWQRYVNS